jgi:hypothetical protein
LTNDGTRSTDSIVFVEINNAASSMNMKITEATSNGSRVSGISSDDAFQQIDTSTSNTVYPMTPLVDSEYATISVVGLPGPVFTIIHTTALSSISISIVVSVSLLIFLCACRKKRKFREHLESEDQRASQTTASGPGRQAVAGSSLGESSGTSPKVDTYRIADDRNSNNGKTIASTDKKAGR